MEPEPRSGPPAMTTRVGSPSVWESMTRTVSVMFWARRDGMADDGQYLFAFRTLERETRRADRLGTETGFRHREFDVLHEFDFSIEVQERRVPAVEFARFRPAPGDRQVPEPAIFLGKSVDQTRNPAVRAEHDRFEDE